MSLSPADSYLAKLLNEFIVAQTQVNANNFEMFKTISDRLDSQRAMIDQLHVLVNMQKQMIDALANVITKGSL